MTHMPAREVELELELPAASLPAIKNLPLLRAVKEAPKRTNAASAKVIGKGGAVFNLGLKAKCQRN